MDGTKTGKCHAQTIENTREKDVTMIAPDDAEVDADDAQDEFCRQGLAHMLLPMPTQYLPHGNVIG